MQIHQIIIDKNLNPEDVRAAMRGPVRITLSDAAMQRVANCRQYLDERMSKDKAPVYGINTGFGALYNVAISEDKLETLQRNLVVSHACGTGAEVPPEIVRLMLVLKIQSLVQGHSGVQAETVQMLAEFVNHDVLPVIYEQGSLGASGDLAPLAHLSLPLLGLGEVYYQSEKIGTEKLFKKLGWQAIQLRSKEGLALLNGTQFMSAYACYCLEQAKDLLDHADMIAALSLDAFDGRQGAFHHLVHEVRPHRGQKETAANVLGWLKGSEIIGRAKRHVQDPYSFRCIPQVHGASLDAMRYAEQTIYTEINSVTDNPTIFPDEDLVISGGNFHGQPLALVLDFLAIALAEIGSISERRAFKLLSGQRELPLFLVEDAGLNSGFMIPQYTAASIVSQNKQLATPSSVDTIDSSNGQEDHVSMGANAATKLLRIVNNLRTILSIELLNAAQALETRRPLKSSAKLEEMLGSYRKVVPFLKTDEVLYTLIRASEKFLRELAPRRN